MIRSQRIKEVKKTETAVSPQQFYLQIQLDSDNVPGPLLKAVLLTWQGGVQKYADVIFKSPLTENIFYLHIFASKVPIFLKNLF